MQYAQKGSVLIESQTPQRLLGIGRFSSLRGARGMRSLRGPRNVRGMRSLRDAEDYVDFDFDFGGDGGDVGSSYDPASYWTDTDPAASYSTDASFYPAYSPPVAIAAPAPTLAPSSNTDFNWSQIPAILKDTFSVYNQATAQAELQKINIERAQKGLTPLDAGKYAPGVQVGLNAKTQQFLGMSLTTVLLAGAGAFLLLRKSGRR